MHTYLVDNVASLEWIFKLSSRIMDNFGHAEYLYLLHFSPIFIQLTCSIPVVSTCFQSEWKAMWILIRWLHQKQSDLGLQCFSKKG